MIRLEKVLKTSLQDVLKMSFKTFSQSVLKMSWRRFEDVLKTSWRLMTKTSKLVLIKTSSGDVWVRWMYSSWSRRLEDVFWRRKRNTPSRRLQDKTYQDECLLGSNWLLIYQYYIKPLDVNKEQNGENSMETDWQTLPNKMFQKTK